MQHLGYMFTKRSPCYLPEVRRYLGFLHVTLFGQPPPDRPDPIYPQNTLLQALDRLFSIQICIRLEERENQVSQSPWTIWVLIGLSIKPHRSVHQLSHVLYCHNLQERLRGRQGGTPFLSFAAKMQCYQSSLSISGLII